jgi:NADH pyrophosphatase NudC (nudix superfamily)
MSASSSLSGKPADPTTSEPELEDAGWSTRDDDLLEFDAELEQAARPIEAAASTVTATLILVLIAAAP